MDQQDLPDQSADQSADQQSGTDNVQEKIDEARGAEEHLLQVMPSGIQPDDDAYEGMSGPLETDVEQHDEDEKTDDERQAESPHRTPTEQVQDDLIDEGDPSDDTGREDRRPASGS